MNSKTTLFLVLLLAAAFAYIKFFDAGQPGTRELAAQAGRVLPGKLDRAKVDALLITQNDVKIDLRRELSQPRDEPGALARWRMQTPLADRADAGVLDTLLADLETLRRESTIPVPGANADRAKLAPYGLQNPRLRLTLTGGGAAEKGSPNVELLFGSDTPVEGKCYVQVAGHDEVLVVMNALRKQLEKPPAELRDHQFTDLAPAEIAHLTVKNTTGTLELTKDGDAWRLLKPMNARAGGPRLTELIGRLADLHVLSFLPEDKAAADAASLGLAEPRGTLTLATADNPPRTAELVLGKPVELTAANAPKDAGAEAAVYARVTGRPSVLTVPKTVEDFLNLKPADVRDRALARVNPDTVDRLRLRPTTGPEITLSRAKGSEKAWTFRENNAGPERPANGAEVERLLSRLPTQNVTTFVADTAAPAELTKYGLDQPALRVVFLSVASETTAESAAGEKPLATVEFGRTEGNIVFARLAEEPFVVSVDKAALETAPADPLAWQAPEIFKMEPDAVRSLAVKPAGGLEMTLERAADKNAPWKLTRGGSDLVTVEANQVQSAVNTLAHLRAVRWVGATRPEHGLDAPAAATLTFGPGSGGGGGKLVLGNRSPEGMWFARVDGRSGTFLVSAPDHTTLTAPLVVAAAPPAPVPSASPAAPAPVR